MTKIVKRSICTVLTFALLITIVTIPAQKIQAVKKAYCASLKLNNDIKLNKKKTFTKTGIYHESTFHKKNKKINVKYTIQNSRKSVGNNYKVTYKVNYKFLEDPKIDSTEISYDDWSWGYTNPDVFYTVFDYQTGMSLETKNKLGVKVKGSEWNATYYPKQTFNYTGPLAEEYKGEELWLRNYKTLSASFTVTYPKNCKNVCVGIGFSNRAAVPSDLKDEADNQYWTGKKPYGKTTYYQKGKQTMTYMRLNK